MKITGQSYKNFWSLNTDEVVVTGLLRSYFKKRAEVFMPLNAQLKDVDLIIGNFNNKKLITLQVKGSKAYEPKISEKRKFGDGSTGWFFIKEETIRDCTADYFVFLVNVLSEDKSSGRRYIEPHTVVISPNELYKVCKEKKILHTNYSFYIWINPKEKKAFDYRDSKQKGFIDLNDNLDEKVFQVLKEALQIS